MSRTASISAIFLIGARLAFGAFYYATPAGGGNNSGDSWDNAVSGGGISSFINNMSPGDKLLIGSGTYRSQIDIDNSGSSGKNIVIEGHNRGSGYPVFKGSYGYGSESGSDCITLRRGARYLELRSLKLEYWKNGIMLMSSSSGNAQSEHNTHIVIDNVDVTRVFQGMYLQDLKHSVIRNCEIVHFIRRGIRFHQGCQFIEVQDCIADQNEGDFSESADWPMGMMVEDGRDEGPNDWQSDITFKRCEARHCREDRNGSTSKYWNGDGFMIETQTPNVKFYECIAYRNQDGGFDDKGQNTYYENCISAHNMRNYRVWGKTKMINCLSVNAHKNGDGRGGAVGLWSEGHTSLHNCTFHNNDGGAVEATLEYAENCIFSSDNPSPSAGSGNIFASDANYVAPSSNYNGHPRDAYNSRKYGPDKGYWYSPPGDKPVIQSLTVSPGTSGETPFEVQFSANATDPDGDDANLTYVWDFGDGGGSTRQNPTYVYNYPGEYGATVTVTDEDQQFAEESKTITVTGNMPPSISFVAPQEGARVAAGSTVGVAVNVTDSDGLVTEVLLHDGTTLLKTFSSPPYSAVLANITAGTHSIKIEATDNDGGTSSKTISIEALGGQAADITFVESGDEPTIDGTADAIWADKPAYSLDKTIVGTVNGASDLSAAWKALWDADNLYFLVDVTDDKISTESGADFWEDDAVEIYLDIN